MINALQTDLRTSTFFREVEAISKFDREPEALIVPYCKTNLDFPSVAAGVLSAQWNIPVIDLNTSQANEQKRLEKPFSAWGMVVPSRAASEMVRISDVLKHRIDILCGTANGPIDIQCCYPFLKTVPCFSSDASFDDQLPFPDYSRFDTFPILLKMWRKGAWFYPIMTSLGCPFGCLFCAGRTRKQQFRSIQYCVDELTEAKEKWGIKRFVVIDDCFNANMERARKFSEAVAPLGLQWMAGNGLRADRFDNELGMLMKGSGCKWVSFGVESTDDHVLDIISKGEDFSRINRAVTSAKRIFDYVNVFLVLGLPGADYQSDKKSIEWAKSKGVSIHICFYVPFNEGVQVDCLFDSPEGRALPETYDKDLQLRLFNLAKS